MPATTSNSAFWTGFRDGLPFLLVLLPFGILLITLFYVDLRVRYEGADIAAGPEAPAPAGSA